MSDVWMGCGIIHRGEPVIADGELWAALLGCGPLYAYRLNGVDALSDTVVNAGSAGSSFDASIFGDANPSRFVTGPDGETYPELGNETSGPAFLMSGDEAFANGYTNGMTWIVVYQATREDGTSGMADGGTITQKCFTSPDSVDNPAEAMLYFGSSLYGGRTKRTFSFQTANWAYYNTKSITTDLWHVLEIYFPPGDTDPIIYLDSELKTGGEVTIVNDGVRVDHGAGYLVLGGDNATGPDGAAGFYAMAAYFDGEIDSSCRDDYIAAAISEGWHPGFSSSVHMTIPASDSDGVSSSPFNFDNTYIVVSGICNFYAGATSDADTTGGSLGVGHSGAFQVWDYGTSAWIHIEPNGGPFTSPQPGNIYVFEHDWGGNPALIRMGDSFWGDNFGSWSVDIYPIA